VVSKGKVGPLDIRVGRRTIGMAAGVVAFAVYGGEVVATGPDSGSLTGDSTEDQLLPRLVLGVGDGRGFGANVSVAKLALADALDPVDDGFELRIHGVGGSSPKQMLEQAETVPGPRPT